MLMDGSRVQIFFTQLDQIDTTSKTQTDKGTPKEKRKWTNFASDGRQMGCHYVENGPTSRHSASLRNGLWAWLSDRKGQPKHANPSR